MTPAAKKPSSSPAVRLARAIVTAALVTLFTLAGVATASASPVQPTSGAVQTLAQCTTPPNNHNWNCAGTNSSVGCALRMYAVNNDSRDASTHITWSGSISVSNHLGKNKSTSHVIEREDGAILFDEQVVGNRTETHSWNPPPAGTYLWIYVQDDDSPTGAIGATQRCRVA